MTQSPVHRRGFTIVELLAVIVVIAILATISIVSYRGIQDCARNTRLQTQLTSARKEIELNQIEHGKSPFYNNVRAICPNSGLCGGAARSTISTYIENTYKIGMNE